MLGSHCLSAWAQLPSVIHAAFMQFPCKLFFLYLFFLKSPTLSLSRMMCLVSLVCGDV